MSRLDPLGFVALLAVAFAVASLSCGGGSSGMGTQVLVEPSESPAPVVDADSYLPLSAGIETSFSGGQIFDGSNVAVQNLKVRVLEDGVIKISGRKVSGDGYADIEETFKFAEEGGAVFLTGSGINVNYSDGSGKTNSRTYNPPITVLADKSSLSEGDVFETEHLTVVFDGDPDVITLWENDNVAESVEITDLEDATATVEVDGQSDFSIGGRDVDAYSISFKWDIASRGLWFPFGFLSNGRFGLAKGIGVVRLDGRDAVEANASE